MEEPTKEDFDFIENALKSGSGKGWAAEILNGASRLQNDFRARNVHILMAMLQMELALREMRQFLKDNMPPQHAAIVERAMGGFSDAMELLRTKYHEDAARKATKQ